MPKKSMDLFQTPDPRHTRRTFFVAMLAVPFGMSARRLADLLPPTPEATAEEFVRNYLEPAATVIVEAADEDFAKYCRRLGLLRFAPARRLLANERRFNPGRLPI